MKRYKLTLSYDGTPFGGWQVQPNCMTVQGCLESTFQTALGDHVPVIASGRTDAGVHAKGQTAHFSFKNPLPDNFEYELNSRLPPEIRILSMEEAPPDFHARFNAKQKTYHYHVVTGEVPDPFERRYRTHLNYTLDLEKLQAALKYFIGTHDFTTFANERGAPCSPIKTIHAINFFDEGRSRFRLEFTGSGFLYKMVRNMVGTLIWIARGKIPLTSLTALFEAKDRRLIPSPAPPQGLFLISVDYPHD